MATSPTKDDHIIHTDIVASKNDSPIIEILPIKDEKADDEGYVVDWIKTEADSVDEPTFDTNMVPKREPGEDELTDVKIEPSVDADLHVVKSESGSLMMWMKEEDDDLKSESQNHLLCGDQKHTAVKHEPTPTLYDTSGDYHGVSEMPLICDICSQRFTNTAALESHIPTHRDNQPHKCDICLERFAQPEDLTKHMIFNYLQI